MQTRPFHLILFWPLRINVRPRNDTGKAEDFWAFVNEQMGLKGSSDWELAPDLLFPDCERMLSYQEAVYFHPFARKVIYAKPDESGPVRLYRHTAIQAVEVDLESNRSKTTLRVERLHLYIFDTQLAILVTEVSHKDQLPLETAMSLQNELRRIYPAGWSKNFQDETLRRTEMCPLHCPHSVRWLVSAGDSPVPYAKAKASNYEYEARDHYVNWLAETGQPTGSKHWTDLLPAMEPPVEGKGKGYHLLGDDRMAAMAFFGLPDPHGVSPADMMRMGLADGPGSWPLPYAPEFLADFEKDFCYDRFWARKEPDRYPMFTTRYMCSGWAFSALASSKDSFVLLDLVNNFRHHYFQMGLLIYLQYSSLLVFSERLSEAVSHARSDGEKYRKSIERVATDLAIFTDRYWLPDVTNQQQGQELYELWVKRLRLREVYEQVIREAGYVNGILAARAAEDLAASQAKLAAAQAQLAASQAELSAQTYALSRIGLPLLVLSVLFGLWGSNWLKGLDEHWPIYLVTGVAAGVAGWVLYSKTMRKKAG